MPLSGCTTPLRQGLPHAVDDTVADRAAVQEAMGSPSFHLDRLWMAWDGDRLVAMSFLEFPVERGHVHTRNTASEPDYRGRGIAQAVKNESVGQAIRLGLPRIRTGNDSQNAPILAINRKLGYVPRYGIWEWCKTVG